MCIKLTMAVAPEISWLIVSPAMIDPGIALAKEIILLALNVFAGNTMSAARVTSVAISSGSLPSATRP